MFARNISNIDFFLKILPSKDNELVMSEMKKKWGGHRENLNLSKSYFVSEEDHSGCKSQNITIRALKEMFSAKYGLNGPIKQIKSTG